MLVAHWLGDSLFTEEQSMSGSSCVPMVPVDGWYRAMSSIDQYLPTGLIGGGAQGRERRPNARSGLPRVPKARSGAL